MNAYAIAKVASRGFRSLPLKQQRKIVSYMVAGGFATEAALQFTGYSPWVIGNNSELMLYCGTRAGTLWIEQSCSSNGSNHNLTVAAFKTWNVPRFYPNQAKHMVSDVVQTSDTNVRATLRGVLWNRKSGDRFASTFYPIGNSFIEVVRPINMAPPAALSPPVVRTIPGLTSIPGESPWERTRYGGWAITQPGRTSPWQKPGEIEWVPGSTVRPSYKPRFIARARPASGTREKKVAFSPAGAVPQVFEWLDKFSEFSEIVDALYKALPSHVRRNYSAAIDEAGDMFGGIGGGGREADATHIKLYALWRHMDELDGEQAAANILVNMAEDMAIGETEQRKGALFDAIRGF